MELVKSIWRIVVASARSCLMVVDQSLSESKISVADDDGQMFERPFPEVVARRAVSVVVATIGTVLMSSPLSMSATAAPLSSSFITIAQELWRGGV